MFMNLKDNNLLYTFAWNKWLQLLCHPCMGKAFVYQTSKLTYQGIKTRLGNFSTKKKKLD